MFQSSCAQLKVGVVFKQFLTDAGKRTNADSEYSWKRNKTKLLAGIHSLSGHRP